MDNLTKTQWIRLAIFSIVLVIITTIIAKSCESDPNPEISTTKSAKAKTEAQIEGKDAERVAITTEQVAKNEQHVANTKKDMDVVDRIVHRKPIKPITIRVR